ncbi:MAG: hypothetical protein ACR2HR_07380 [Euzebya sp.]
MTRTASIDTLRSKISGITDEERREAAAKEARRRWEEARAVLTDRADALGDAAEEHWGHARQAARPQVKKLRKKAKKARKMLDADFDLDRFRSELSSVGSQLGHGLTSLSVDLRDAGAAEADRIIQAVHASAEEVRLKTVEQERKQRVRALVGWTIFGMVAGAVLATQFGPKQADEPADLLAAELTDDVTATEEESLSDHQ